MKLAIYVLRNYLVSIPQCRCLPPSPTPFVFQVGRKRIRLKMDMKMKWILVALAIFCIWVADGNVVFPVHHKFKGREKSLSSIVAHDSVRRGRFLSAVDLNLGGNGLPSKSGLYYTKIGLGSPPKDFHVQVDTGSDILWVNAVECTNCPKKSDLGIKLALYDANASRTSSIVSCGDDFCTAQFDTPNPNCKQETPCSYRVTYGDGSTIGGYFVKDHLTFNRVDGNLHTTPENGTVTFGCGASQGGMLSSSDDAVDGIIGFGQSNSSALSQLAAAGKVKKVFSHCLDNIHGGGIFAIGEVVEPKVNRTPLVPNMPHYNVVLEDVVVDDKDFLSLPMDPFNTGTNRPTIIDSGTTLAYLPEMIYDQLMAKVMARQAKLKLYLLQKQFTCFRYEENIDDGFPVVEFRFKKSLTLKVYPHDYLFQIEDLWCVGWMKTVADNKDDADITLLGDLVFSNKLVIYDLENMTIGWTEFNCSSTIKVKDETKGTVYEVASHDISSSSSTLFGGRILTFLVLLIAMQNILN